MGVEYSTAEIKKVLQDIGATVSQGDSGLVVIAPSWRPDLQHKTDLVEEIARITGYDRIGSVLPVAPPGRGLTREQQFTRATLNLLAATGCTEVLSYPFVSASSNDLFADSKKSVALVNPLQEEAGQLRMSLLPGLIETAHRNLSRGLTDLAIVEQGSVFVASKAKGSLFPDTAKRPTTEEISNIQAGIPSQPKHIAGLFLGSRVQGKSNQKSFASGVEDAMEAARVVGFAVGAELSIRQSTPKGFHPGRSGELLVGETVVGVVGELDPSVSKSRDLPRTVGVFEIDLDALFRAAPVSIVARPFGTLPAATQDLSLVVDIKTPAADVLAAVEKGAGALLEEIILTDDYRGPNVQEGSKSLTFALRFRAMDRTLTQAEATEARDAGVEMARKKFRAEIRS
jgi:phenylalanyl-tRNA synthetase beta chain